MLTETTELATYSRATEIATRYAAATANIRRLALELGEQVSALKETFSREDCYLSRFDVQLELSRNNYAMESKGIDKMLLEIRREAWAVLIDKLGIKKLMSSKDAGKLNDWLQNRNPSHSSEPMPDLPEIDADTIMSVMSGMVQSAPEYLVEKIKEAYRWLVPYNYDHQYATNKLDRIGRKVVKRCCVDRHFGGKLYHVSHYHEKDLISLDSIFHALDGKGILSGHRGPLVDAINMSETGTGSTDYFKFRCFKNGNLHLEFLRDDLLQEFNRVAVDGHRLGGEMARKNKRSA